MKESMDALFSAPLANILVVAGVVFLLVAVLGTVAGKIDPGKGGRIAAGAIGVVLLAVGLSMHLVVAKMSDGVGVAKEEARVQQQAEEEARRETATAKPPNPCEPIRITKGATCGDFYAERSNWSSNKISKCGRYQVSRYQKALKIRSKSDWTRFLRPCNQLK